MTQHTTTARTTHRHAFHRWRTARLLGAVGAHRPASTPRPRCPKVDLQSQLRGLRADGEGDSNAGREKASAAANCPRRRTNQRISGNFASERVGPKNPRKTQVRPKKTGTVPARLKGVGRVDLPTPVVVWICLVEPPNLSGIANPDMLRGHGPALGGSSDAQDMLVRCGGRILASPPSIRPSRTGPRLASGSRVSTWSAFLLD